MRVGGLKCALLASSVLSLGGQFASTSISRKFNIMIIVIAFSLGPEIEIESRDRAQRKSCVKRRV